jgi:spore coat polysaccharide biosynthesis protein SpsF
VTVVLVPDGNERHDVRGHASDRQTHTKGAFLIGDRIHLRPLSEEDARGPWVDWFNDQQVTQAMFHGAFPATVESHLAFLRRVTSSATDLVLAIIETQTARHIGNVGLHDINWIDRKAEVGIIIGDRTAHGQGYGTDVLRTIVRHAFDRLTLNKLWAAMHASNQAAVRAFESAGFRVEARLSQEVFRDGEYHDALRMGLPALEYRRRGFLKIGAVVEARMGSTRLPGKSLRPIDGKPLLQLLLERLKRVKSLDAIVVATPESAANDHIEDLAVGLGAACLRGSESDVMDRVRAAAQAMRLDVIVGITADCPLTDPAIVEECVRVYLAGEYDYVCNFLTRTFPDGFEVQVYSREVLEDAARKTQDPEDREHGTRYIHERAEEYRLANVTAPADLNYPGLRLDVDNAEDFEALEHVYRSLHPTNANFGLREILQFLEERPDVRSFDRSVRRRPKNPDTPFWEDVHPESSVVGRL